MTVASTRAADPSKDEGIRILPATKAHAAVSRATMLDEPRPHRTTKPPVKQKSDLPPLPAPETSKPEKPVKQDGGQLRIIPAKASPGAANVQRFEQLYRAIPYRRLAYERNPMYRQDLALSLLLNQFPPPPTIVMPGDSGMGQGGSMSNRGGIGGPMNYGSPINPPSWMLTVPPQWLF
jgi:hypothetical protein